MSLLSKLALAWLASLSIVSVLWEHGGLMFWECQQLMRDIVLLELCSSSIEVNKPSVN